MEANSLPLRPKTSFKNWPAFKKKKAEYSELKIRNTRNEILVKDSSFSEKLHTLPQSFMVRERLARDSLTLFMFVQVRQAKTWAKKKKCQLAINLPPCSCPNPPVSPLIPLFFLHLLFYDLSLFCLRTIRIGSHVGQLTPAFTLLKVGRLYEH